MLKVKVRISGEMSVWAANAAVILAVVIVGVSLLLVLVK